MFTTDRRPKLHNLLKELTGINNVYYQPPESVKLKYPCIIYSKRGKDITRADNRAWNGVDKYEAIIVTNKPDTDYADRVLEGIQHCAFNRRYVSNNLYHDLLTIFY